MIIPYLSVMIFCYKTLMALIDSLAYFITTWASLYTWSSLGARHQLRLTLLNSSRCETHCKHCS